MMPLIDVVFLLLTFFIYALVLMVRADLLPIALPELAAGEPAERITPIVILLDQEGALFVNAESAADITDVIAQLTELKREQPDAPVILAADEHGETDRLPLAIELIDKLRMAGIGDFSIMGRPAPLE